MSGYWKRPDERRTKNTTPVDRAVSMNVTPALDNLVESLDLNGISSALDDRGDTVLPSVISPRDADDV